jgi:hypothetical protein
LAPLQRARAKPHATELQHVAEALRALARRAEAEARASALASAQLRASAEAAHASALASLQHAEAALRVAPGEALRDAQAQPLPQPWLSSLTSPRRR